MNKPSPIELQFSKKYNQHHSENYFKKHKTRFWRSLSNWREQSIARKSLRIAGNPKEILDLPCGAGRFWEMLAEDSSRKLWAADDSEHMLGVAQTEQPPDLVDCFKIFRTSAFKIDLADNAVDNIFCMRLLHHVGDSRHRIALLNEFRRVARQSICISLWIDGNLKASRRKKLEIKRSERTGKNREYQNRFVIPKKTIEPEFRKAGFEIVDKIDFLRGISMWRIYVLGIPASH